jgi:hypothetical protein
MTPPEDDWPVDGDYKYRNHEEDSRPAQPHPMADLTSAATGEAIVNGIAQTGDVFVPGIGNVAETLISSTGEVISAVGEGVASAAGEAAGGCAGCSAIIVLAFGLLLATTGSALAAGFIR